MLLRRLALLFLTVCFLFTSHSARAEVAPDEEKDEYDFSWLDPDKKIYVVQNRKFTKARKVEIALTGGVGLSEPYRQTKTVLPRFFYYINESFGLSVFAGFNTNKENDNSIVLRSSKFNINPIVRDVNSFYGASFLWLPFYGKINMFNKILYLDWHFEAGLNSVSTEMDLSTAPTNPTSIITSTHTGFHWGTGQKFFITRNWAARLDFLAIYYSAPQYTKANSSDVKMTLTGMNESHERYFVTLGASYTF